jgi:pyridoxine 5-phosphate synthase
MIALSVNLNKIALVRNSRQGNFPDLLQYARRCLDAGAQGITVHPRPDQRHIRAADIPALYALVAQHPGTEFNIEGNPFSTEKGNYPGYIALVTQWPPHQCTLVPDTDRQLTSDHGFDLRQNENKLADMIQLLKSLGIRVSLFMDPDIEQIARAASMGADRIELYTGPFAASHARNPSSEETLALFKQHCRAADKAHESGLGVNAGHDLNLSNLAMYRQLPHLAEVSIGHALTVDAIDMGWNQALHAYLHVLDGNDETRS